MSGVSKPPAPADVKELARSCGIATEFENARGETVSVDDAVLARLLDSMGMLAAGRKPSRQAESQRSILPPAIVAVPADGAITVRVNGIAAPRIAWQLTLEDGQTRRGASELDAAPPDTMRQFRLPDVPFGYHHLALEGVDAGTTLIVTPGQCWLPRTFGEGGRLSGLSLQLYLLRSATNWGIGDFSDLRRFAVAAAGHGCDIIGLNPLHQMFPDDPDRASPYSPATRHFLNILYIDVDAIPEFRASAAARALVGSADFKRSLADCRSADHVDYRNVTRLKLQGLRLAYAEFEARASEPRRAAFAGFIARTGELLGKSSLFQALRNHFSAADPELADWSKWPPAYRKVTSAEVGRFAREHADEIAFFNWTQWIADQQLAEARDAAMAAGMRIGFYRDLAVGCDRAGAETWSRPADFLVGASVGAPPDILNPSGQNWGLPPFNPVALRREAYQPFIELVRANMLHAGGLRIDHVMGLQRLYCIPQGSPGSEGSYVSYPLDDLVGILALESQRHRCIVVGEDLGTVPAGFREKMADANILSYRVLFFEKQGAADFVPPEHYPRLAVAVAGSHDLPTLRGWLAGHDIALKDSLNLYASAEETAAQNAMRDQERAGVLQALQIGDAPDGVSPAGFSEAVHRFLGQTSSVLAITQLDDLLAETTPVNVPGTSDEHANWRRKYSQSLEDIAGADHAAWRLLAMLVDERGR